MPLEMNGAFIRVMEGETGNHRRRERKPAAERGTGAEEPEQKRGGAVVGPGVAGVVVGRVAGESAVCVWRGSGECPVFYAREVGKFQRCR